MPNFLVTGGTGSLGKQIVLELLKDKEVEKIRVYSRSEYLQSEMAKEIKDSRLRYFIGDVRDYQRLSRAMDMVDYVIHCAAMKRVESCESNPIEAVKTNIMGSANIIDTAVEHGVRKVLGISSDKGVYPVNLYGATKLAMEKLFIHSDGHGETMFSCCRMGNFIGSRGSLLPALLDGKKVGRIFITDGEARRYYIPLHIAAAFVVKCLWAMEGGEIFVPKMREMTVNDWADIVAPEAEREFIGLGKGERKAEPLFTEEEELKKVDIGDGWRIK